MSLFFTARHRAVRSRAAGALSLHPPTHPGTPECEGWRGRWLAETAGTPGGEPKFPRALRNCALALLALAAMEAASLAATIPTGADPQPYRDYATNNFQGTLMWERFTVPGVGTSTNSAAFLGFYNVLDQSGNVTLVGKAETAGHNLASFLATYNPGEYTISLGTGDNYLTNPGIVLTVNRTVVHPGYNINDTNNTPDIADLEFDPAPLLSLGMFHNLAIGKGVAGTVGTHAGFGVLRDPSTGTSIVTGDAMAWNAVVLNSPIVGADEYLDATNWSSHSPNNPALPGQGSNRDSGGPVGQFQPDGSFTLWGITKGGTGTGDVGTTSYTDLTGW